MPRCSGRSRRDRRACSSRRRCRPTSPRWPLKKKPRPKHRRASRRAKQYPNLVTRHPPSRLLRVVPRAKRRPKASRKAGPRKAVAKATSPLRPRRQKGAGSARPATTSNPEPPPDDTEEPTSNPPPGEASAEASVTFDAWEDGADIYSAEATVAEGGERTAASLTDAGGGEGAAAPADVTASATTVAAEAGGGGAGGGNCGSVCR